MGKNKVVRGNFGGFSKDLINEGRESTNKDLEKLKKEKSAQAIENKKESEPIKDKAEVGEQPQAVPPVPPEKTKTEAETPPSDPVEQPPVQTPPATKPKEVEKEATSITLDKDVLMKMKLYCKANKLSLSGEINKYLKNQYIPKKKVTEFLKNMFG